MSENFGAIDARFKGVDDKFITTNQTIGKLEGRVEKLEDISNYHSNGFTKHEGAIERMGHDITSISNSVSNILSTMNKGIGALKIINLLFGVAITLIVAWIGYKS